MALDLYIAENLWRRQVRSRLSGLPTAWIVGSKTLNPPNILNGAQATTTVPCSGCVLGDLPMVSFSLDTQGVVLTAQVTAADVVTVTFRNDTGAPVDLGSGTLRVAVFPPDV